MVEKKEHVNDGEHKVSKKIKVNYWMVAAIALAVLLLGVLIFNNIGKVSANQAGKILTNFAESQGVTLNVLSVTSNGSFYAVTAEIQGQTGTFYVSKDGKYFTSALVPITASKSTTNSNTGAASSNEDACSQDIITRFGMNLSKVEELAFSATGVNLLKAEETASSKYGVSASPTLIINGVQSSAIYSGTDAVKTAICSSFTQVPTECNGVKLNSTGMKKSAKPVVELFVMSYCPYGVRAENNIFALQDLFGSKIDLKVRFIVNVNGDTISQVQSLHGPKEAKEDARQLAIMQLYSDKYWSYLKEFNNVCYGGGAPSSSGSCG